MTPDNSKATILRVNFFDLEEYDPRGERCRKRVCPTCEDGLLLMTRDPRTLELMDHDSCTLCGQRVVYLDIERVRHGTAPEGGAP